MTNMGVDHENHRESTHSINITYSLVHHKYSAKVLNNYENAKLMVALFPFSAWQQAHGTPTLDVPGLLHSA